MQDHRAGTRPRGQIGIVRRCRRIAGIACTLTIADGAGGARGQAVEIALDVEVESEVIELSTLESPVDRDVMPVEVEVESVSTVLATVLRPLEVEVDKESMLLEVEVESEVRSLLALLRLVDKDRDAARRRGRQTVDGTRNRAETGRGRGRQGTDRAVR